MQRARETKAPEHSRFARAPGRLTRWVGWLAEVRGSTMTRLECGRDREELTEHLIELNEIHHVCLETGDVGAIYTGRDCRDYTPMNKR